MSEHRPSYQGRIAYQAAILGFFATLSTALLLIGDKETRGAIAQRQAEDIQASLSQVIPPALHDNNLLENRMTLDYKGKPVEVFRGTRDGEVTALAYQVAEYGYGGEITLMMAVDQSGAILGVRVLAHTETPGLGDKIEASKSNWINSFNTLSLDNTPTAQWAVKKDGGRFDQFSGATITPRAVVKAVKSGLDFFHSYRQQLTTMAINKDNKPATPETRQ